MKNIIIRLLNKLKLLKFFNLYGNTTINKKRYKIPILGKIGIHNLYNWEPWMNTILSRIIKIEEGIFVDIGVNIGQTLLKIKSISPEIEYIGFEPNPSCNHYLNLLIRKNNIKNTKMFPVGVSQSNNISELTLYGDLQSDGAASIMSNFRPTNKIYGKKYVPIFKFETITQNYNIGKISLLKIDVEGAESDVLMEFEEKIKKDKPIILIEILPVYNSELEERLIRQQVIESLMVKLNYVIYRIETFNQKLVGINKIKKIGIHSNIDECDYIFVPKIKIEKFEYYCQQSINPIKLWSK